MVVRAGGAGLRNRRAESSSNSSSANTSTTRSSMRRALVAAAAVVGRRAAAGAASSSSSSSSSAWRPRPPSLLLTSQRQQSPSLTTCAAAAAEAPSSSSSDSKKTKGKNKAKDSAAADTANAASSAPSLPAAGDFAALRRLTQLHNTMSRAKEPFVPASILPSRPLAQRAAAALVSPDRKTTPNGGASSTAATLAAAADAAFTAAEQSTSSSSNSNPKVTMYVCGVTVYDLSHIGHARAYVAFDVLLRFLSKALKYDVRYVRNFTDVDDKIIARAAKLMMQEEKEGGGANGNGNGNGNGAAPATTAVSAEAALALASRFIDEFRADMTALHCLPPADEPRATQYLDEMVRTIERIIDHGHAYSCGDGSGDVFFDVRSLPNYGLLSGRTDQSVNRAGASERVAVDPRKRDAADFALWKGAKAGEPSWPSPWGPGRPGWHIECSAMIRAVLGEDPIDIHGGGRDLVFPHHENELAQSRAALAPCGCCEGGGEAGAVVAAAEEEGGEEDVAASSGPSSRKPPLPPPEDRDFVRYWVHNGFVNVDSEKMSKSLGNFFTIRDASASHGALTLRWLLVGSHYRQPLYYTQRALDEAADRLFYVYQALADADAALQEAAKEAADVAAAGAGTAAAADDANQKAKKAPATDPPPPSPTEALAYILAGKGPGGALASAASASLADDLNTPAAVGALSPALKALNDLLHTRAGRRTKGRPSLIASYRAALSYVLGDLLGFPTHEPESALASLRAAALRRAGLTEEALGERVAARAEARANKDFAAADAVRAELAAKGVFLMDAASGSGGGSAWRPGVPEEEQEGEAKGDAAAAAAAEAPA